MIFFDLLCRVKEDTAAHIASLKASHQREVEKLLCQNAVENSSSKVAELNRKIATQEVDDFNTLSLALKLFFSGLLTEHYLIQKYVNFAF